MFLIFIKATETTDRMRLLKEKAHTLQQQAQNALQQKQQFTQEVESLNHKFEKRGFDTGFKKGYQAALAAQENEARSPLIAEYNRSLQCISYSFKQCLKEYLATFAFIIRTNQDALKKIEDSESRRRGMMQDQYTQELGRLWDMCVQQKAASQTRTLTRHHVQPPSAHIPRSHTEEERTTEYFDPVSGPIGEDDRSSTETVASPSIQKQGSQPLSSTARIAMGIGSEYERENLPLTRGRRKQTLPPPPQQQPAATSSSYASDRKIQAARSDRKERLSGGAPWLRTQHY